MNFTGTVVLTFSAKYTKIFVCIYGFGIQLMTSSKMSTNRVTALECSNQPLDLDYLLGNLFFLAIFIIECTIALAYNGITFQLR